jgi:tRNA-dihydrouridine synthase B
VLQSVAMKLDFSIRNLRIAPGLVLAPMSGVTCSAFRRLIKELNPGAVGLVVSEFVSVEGLTRGSLKTLDMLKFQEHERPYGIQIFGYDVQRMADGAKLAQDLGADVVDINCGCPAPKVVKNGGGCELMRQPEHLQKIVAGVRKAISVPLTLKMRSGWSDETKNCIDVARMCEAEGVEALTVHGRTREALYRGLADWSVIQSVAESVKIPVCGSGDVVSHESALERIKSGVSGLYIGRAALFNPTIFSEICDGKQKNIDPRKVVLRYSELLLEDFEPRYCVGRMKQLSSQLGQGQEWAKLVCRATSLEEQLSILGEEPSESAAV